MKDHIAVTYVIRPKVESIERAAELLMAEMTSGIQYTSLKDGIQMDCVRNAVPFVDDSVDGEITAISPLDDGSYRVKFDLPLSNFDVRLGGLTNLWPMVAGEIFNFYFIESALLEDLELPQALAEHYLGPQFGVPGIRELTAVHSGPLFGAIIKPNLGLDPGKTAALVGLLARAGFDFVKDDEICVSPALCPLEERVRRTALVIDRVAQKRGKRLLYMANVTSDFSILERLADTAVEAGAGGLMIDPFCTGFSSIDFLRRRYSVPLYCHRVGYGLFCAGGSRGIAYEVFSRIFRMLGADFSHVGGIWGGSKDARLKVGRYLNALREGSGRPAAVPVVSGISLENMHEYYEFYGGDTLFLDHIDIYRDEQTSRRKLSSLRNAVIQKV